MLPTLSAKLIALGLAALLIVSVVSGGYLYVKHLDDARVAAEKVSAALEVAKAAQDETIQQQTEHAQQIAAIVKADQEANAALAAASAQTQASVDRLAATLQKHNLGNLANAKPTLVQASINRGTAAALDGLRQASTPHGDDKGRGAAGPTPVPPTPSGTPQPVDPSQSVAGAAKGRPVP